MQLIHLIHTQVKLIQMSSDLIFKNASLDILVMMDIENLIKNEENEY